MVDLLLVWVRLCIGFADTLGNNACVALCVASIFTVLALHTSRVLEKVSAKRTAHNVVELLRNKLVAVHLVNLFLPLSNGTLTIETKIEWSSVLGLLGETNCQVNCSSRLESEPGINWLWRNCTRSGHASAHRSRSCSPSTSRRRTKLWRWRIHVKLWRRSTR